MGKNVIQVKRVRFRALCEEGYVPIVVRRNGSMGFSTDSEAGPHCWIIPSQWRN